MTISSELRIASVNHSNDLAKVRKNMDSILQYELAMLIDMASCNSWDVSPDKVLRQLKSIEQKVLLVKQIGRTE